MRMEKLILSPVTVMDDEYLYNLRDEFRYYIVSNILMCLFNY